MTLLYPDFGAVEDLLLGIFRTWFDGQDVHISDLFTEGMQLPAVVARADRRSGLQAFGADDDRFMRSTVVSINCFSFGPDDNGLNADKHCAQLAESCTLAMRHALASQLVIPGVGHLAHYERAQPFTRVTDWQTSTSVVQYASLPSGVVRYEGIYRILYRPPKGGSGNPFLPTT